MVSINCSFPIMIGNIVFVEMIFVKKILCEIAASTLTEDQVCWKADVRWWGQVSSNIWHLQKKQKKNISIDRLFRRLLSGGHFLPVDGLRILWFSWPSALISIGTSGKTNKFCLKQTIFFLPQQNLKSKFIFLIRHRYLTFFDSKSNLIFKYWVFFLFD